MSTLPYFLPQSDEQQMRHLSRESEQARRDITNLQRQIDKSLGDVIPSDSGASTNGFAIGTLAATMQRGQTGKAFTVAVGDTDCTLVGDYLSQIPTDVTLPSGGSKLYSARKVGSVWCLEIPGYLYCLEGTCAAIASGSTGTVTTAYGSLTSVQNNSDYDALAGWCLVTYKEADSAWVLSNFNPDCPAP